MTWMIFVNSFGTADIDNTEHGHYASDCYATFCTLEEAEDAINSQEFSDWLDRNYPEES